MGAPLSATVASLQREISACERQLQRLRTQLADAEAAVAAASAHSSHDDDALLTSAIDGGFPVEWQGETMAALAPSHTNTSRDGGTDGSASPWPLSADEYKRYGRQLIMPEVGLQGQRRLRAARVLVVGAGGLGCPAAAYLAGAGVGALGLVDGDTVEESNLHRQILHSSHRVGMAKVESAIASLRALNPLVRYHAHRHRLAPSNALSLVADYDIVLDCTDTPASRYLISDACVLLRKPLVSASALRTEGQLMVLNSPPRAPGDKAGGPCYRCVFPRPPPPESVVSCGEGGILGPVVGVMGVLQALEAIKLITAGGLEDTGSSISTPEASPDQNTTSTPTTKPSLLLFSATSNPPFRTFAFRTRKPTCAACSAQATITPQALTSGSMDYVQFCGLPAPVTALAPAERISPAEYVETFLRRPQQQQQQQPRPHILLDVRERVQFELGALEGSINVPWSLMSSMSGAETVPQWLKELRSLPASTPIVVTCRLGNDSQLAVRKLQTLKVGGVVAGKVGGADADADADVAAGAGAGGNKREGGADESGSAGGAKWAVEPRRIVDLRGGLSAWRRDVDAGFPDF